MPERVCCNTEFMPFRLLRTARVAAMRLTSPDRYRAITALRHARAAAYRLGRAGDRRALKTCEAGLHTQMQGSLTGRMRLSSHSLLPFIDEVFAALDRAAEAMEYCRRRGTPKFAAGPLLVTADLLGCLELQLSAASRQGALLYAGRFAAGVSALHDDLRSARAEAMAGEDHAAAATVITALEQLLLRVARVSHEASRARLRRGSRRG